METTPVNWETLDSLVTDFARSENLLEGSQSPSSSYRSRLLILQIRRSTEAGDIQTTVDLIRRHAPALLDDHRILFRLHKQRFLELLRKGTEGERNSAIECLRVALAPCALNAYPEAYEEFKHILLALIFDESDQTSPVASEWSEERRFDLAGLLSTILRAHLHAYDPVFPMALRYLISIHKAYCLRQGIASPISDLTDRLLLEDRDPPATPQESLFEAPPFDEVDIQALAHAVELTRQAAVDSLRFAKGDLFQAFQNELCRVRMDVSLLDDIVQDYCVYRGIVDSCIKSPTAAKLVNDQSKDFLNFDSRNGRLSDGEASVNNLESECARDANADSVSMQTTDVEMRFASEATSHREDCSNSDGNHEQSCRRLRRSRYLPNRQRSRKRWRGRVVKWEVTPYASSSDINKQDLMSIIDHSGYRLSEDQVSNNHSSLESVNCLEDSKYEVLLEIKDLVDKGLAAEVFEEVNAIDPDFFVQNPILFFQLKQVEFLKLVSDGNIAMALKVACTHLGPLAANNQALLKSLKETLLVLLSPSEAAPTKGIPLSVLSTSVQVAMSRRLGIEEPQLMKIMRATLHTHNEWFKLQMCKDRFEELLKINQLKDVDSPVNNNAMLKQHSDNCTYGSSQSTICSSSKLPEDGSSPSPVSSSSEGLFDETAIIKVMEFLALPRADAIHLLMQYNGNAESAIQQIFS